MTQNSRKLHKMVVDLFSVKCCDQTFKQPTKEVAFLVEFGLLVDKSGQPGSVFAFHVFSLKYECILGSLI